jgi:hypothetical protein
MGNAKSFEDPKKPISTQTSPPPRTNYQSLVLHAGALVRNVNAMSFADRFYDAPSYRHFRVTRDENRELANTIYNRIIDHDMTDVPALMTQLEANLNDMDLSISTFNNLLYQDARYNCLQCIHSISKFIPFVISDESAKVQQLKNEIQSLRAQIKPSAPEKYTLDLE